MQDVQPTWMRYGYGVLAVVAALGAALVLRSFDLEGFMFVIAVAVTVWFGGRGPGIVAVLLSVLVLDYFFLSGTDTWTTIIPSHVGYFVLFAVLTLLITMLSETRHRAEQSLLESRTELEARIRERTAALESSNEQLRLEIAERKRQAELLNLAHDAILVRDADDRILFWNRGAERLYGCTEKEALGRVSHDLLQTKLPASLESIDEAVRARGTWEGELTHVRRDGTVIVVASRWSVQRDEQGGVVSVMEINRDVTDRKQAEEALHRAETTLAHVTRLTTLGEVTASFAHELNQPLAAIVNNANASLAFLPEGRADLDEVREALGDIVGDAERASAVIERVRALARRSLAERLPLAIEKVVGDVVALAASSADERRVSVRTEVAPDLPNVMGDRVQLQQVLLNLVVNAMDAMADVEAGERALLIRAWPQTEHGRASATVSVEDHGMGLDGVDLEKVFDAFYTTKPNGMGMGLAISRSIIQAHGGRLWAERNAAGGASFRFSLPAAES